jgi:hypothetical protein
MSKLNVQSLSSFAIDVVSSVVAKSLTTERVSLKRAALIQSLIQQALPLLVSPHSYRDGEHDDVPAAVYHNVVDFAGNLLEIIGKISIEGEDHLDSEIGVTDEKVISHDPREDLKPSA